MLPCPVASWRSCISAWLARNSFMVSTTAASFLSAMVPAACWKASGRGGGLWRDRLSVSASGDGSNWQGDAVQQLGLTLVEQTAGSYDHKAQTLEHEVHSTS
eukprot:11370879-Alexandrium_andersonii.AAC.1